ncbi:MAG: pseudouridine synthase [Chryseolinea sp.]
MPNRNSSDRPRGRKPASGGSKSAGKSFDRKSNDNRRGKPDGDSDRPRGKFSKGADAKSSSRGSGFSSRPGGSKSSGQRSRSSEDDSSKRPFRSANSGGFGSAPRGRKRDDDASDKKPFEKRDFRKSSARSEGGESRPYKRPFKSDGDRSSSGPSRSRRRDDEGGEKKSFEKRDSRKSSPRSEGGESRPYKRPFKSDGDKSFGGPRRSGKRDDENADKKPFERRESRDSGGEKRPYKRPFKADGGKSFDGPARPKRRDDGNGDKKPFERRESRDSGGEKRPYKKTSGFGGDKPFSNSRPRRETNEESDRSFEKRAAKKFELQGVSKGGKSIRGDKAGAAETKPGGPIRLNKFIANSGVCSRREADELITMGLISVNGTVVTTLGYKVNPGDEVRHEDKVLRAEKPVYVLMNKPKGFLTTTADPQERNTVMHIVGNLVKERIYPVGRLDRNTTGLLLLTNDGDLADKLMHPSYNVKKIYKVDLDRPLTKADAQKITEGVHLEEGKAIVDELAIISEDSKTVGLEIHIGWNRVVRRIFESLGYQVVKLDRSFYAGLTKKDLGRGEWRFLTKEELVLLKHFK